jgi:hypothetical protein
MDNLRTNQQSFSSQGRGDEWIIFAAVREGIGPGTIGALALEKCFDEDPCTVDGLFILLPLTPAQSLHHPRQAAAVVKIGGVAQILVAGDKFSRVVLDIESLAQPVACGL